MFDWFPFLATRYELAHIKQKETMITIHKDKSQRKSAAGNTREGTLDCVGLTVYFPALPAISWTARAAAALLCVSFSQLLWWFLEN